MDRDDANVSPGSAHTDHDDDRTARKQDSAIPPNPPRTVSGNTAAPKFGSAGSGGAELEPGPERD